MKDIEHTQTATIITPINCVISKAVPPPKNKPKVPSLAGVLHANNPTASVPQTPFKQCTPTAYPKIAFNNLLLV